jgi:hypothetical protein
MTKCLATLTAVAMGVALMPQAARADEVPVVGSFSVVFAFGAGQGLPNCGANQVFIEAHSIGSTANVAYYAIDGSVQSDGR